jgi:uncharacterized protein YbaP (TraB family)
MKKLFLIFFLLPIFFTAQNRGKYPSLLWKISGNGLKKPSYLYGTMHVSNRVAYHLSEQFFEALKNSEIVGLETNPGEWLQNMEKTGELSQVNQFSNPYANQNFYKSAFTLSFPERRMLQGILSYDPDIINGLLYRHNRSRENFEENTYIDLFIFQSASKLNKQVISLEDFVQSEIKARLSSQPDDEQETNAQTYREMYGASQKIEDAYREGNLDMLDSLSKITTTKNMQRYLINDRNVFFVNTIDSVIKKKSLFSGVGAAHLPGEEGMIELLRKKGYTVEPVLPRNSRKSDQIRDQLDAKVKPVNFVKQFVSDSTFSVMVPGNLTQIVNLENIKYYIHADMVNGNFYTIVRLKYSGPLSGITPQQMQQRIDSMLFEYIPGKITSKKEVANSGLKGIDIHNKTRRGDEQHYQIFFNEMEVILFKLGGKQKYASGTEAKQFFNSIQFYNRSENMVLFSPPTKGFSVKIPANYSYVKNTGSSVKGLVEDVYSWHKGSRTFYGLKRAVYNDFNYLEEDTFELNILSKNILVNFNFREKVKKELTEDLGFPAIKISGVNKQGQIFTGRLLIKGVHYYLQYIVSDKEPAPNNEFFTSFKLSDFESTNRIQEVYDDDFHFKVVDEVSVSAFSKFNEQIAEAFEKLSVVKEKESTPYFDYHSATKSYYSPSSNEYVSIAYEKYNDYDYRTVEEMEEQLLTTIRDYNSLIPTNVKSEKTASLYKFSTVIKDTGTRRAIDLRVIVKNGVRYEISAPFDTVIGLRGWTKTFMETFTPKDSVIGKNIFENKFSLLLDHLSSADTALRKQANVSLTNAIGMQKAYLEDYIKFLKDKRVDQVNEDSKAQLFVNGGTSASEKIIEPYRNLYKQYTDSFYLQLCLLKGLAYLKTQNSYNAFSTLILSEVPLVGTENTVSDVFNVLNDSLELCKKFFPGFLSLTRYEEYRPSVYGLLASLVSKKIISPSVYQSYKSTILGDANLALKRYNPNKTVNNSDYSNDYDYLDKSLKELAESLQSSLEGLSNNNLYKGSAYLKNIDAVSRPELVNYAFILSPFYRSDEKVKQFFTKLTKIKSQNVTMPVAINLLKQNIVLNDTLVEFYAKNKNTRTYFYTELEKEKLTEKFNKDYLSQEALVESVIASQKQLSTIYGYDKDRKQKDSLMLFKKIRANNKYQAGNIYIYRVAKTRRDEDVWAVAFVGDSKLEINPSIEIVNVNYAVDSRKSEEENINQVLSEFRLSYRKRAVNVYNNPYYVE